MDVTTGMDLSTQHLLAELMRIDALLRREVRRWQLAGQDPADAFRGLYVSDGQADALLARSLGMNWGHMAAPGTTDDSVFAEAEGQAVHQAQSLSDMAREQGEPLRLERLSRVFGLDRFETDTFLICLAPALDLRYERLYGYLQDDVTRKSPTVSLILDLLCESVPDRLDGLAHFAADAPLFKYRLIEKANEPGANRPPLLAQTLCPDETAVSWLLGRYQPHPDLGSHAALLRSPDHQTTELLAEGVLADIDRAASGHPLVVFHGPDQTSQQAAAHALAGRTGRLLLSVDLKALADTGTSPVQLLKLALRDARLSGALPYLTGWDVCLVDGAPPPDLLAELCAFPAPVIVAGQKPWRAKGIDRERNLLWLEFPIPAYPQRRALWTHLVGAGASEAELDIASLAGQFLLTSGQIRDAVASAKDEAEQREDSLCRDDLFRAARAHSNPRLADLARKIVPRYDWDDIVLPVDQLTLLREIIATVRGRPTVLDEWGVGRKLVASRGVTVLFAGPPGTGKTMAAEVIAGELGLDLYKIDLSTIVSKYIGETEKNLERIFTEATTSNSILFFDEADALFGKRSEVRDSHDRYANIEISYLLQRMEAYDGVTILATNMRANLDEAFTRRLQFAVDFPFPEEEYRLRIWQSLFPADVPSDAELDFALMAHRFKLAGGNIRNIIVAAAYLAATDGRQVTMGHLMHGTRRELQKMGRLIGEEDLRID